MPHVILQPSGHPEALDNYRRTIQTPVRFDDYASVLGSERGPLAAAFPSGEAPLWGVTAASGNPSAWERCEPGDVVLFTGGKRAFGRATIVHRFINDPLSRALWGVDAEGRPWDYMYALTDVRSLDIPYEELNEVLGYKPNYTFRRFTVLDRAKSEALVDAFDLFSEDLQPQVSEAQYRDAVTAPPTQLDVERRVQQRTESAFIRQRLFPNPIATCDLCGEVMPRAFLIGAHIKKRAACTDDEKLDIPNVVMAACVFGCDALFEKGYVTVGDDWGLRVVGATGSPSVDARLAQLAGRAFPHQQPARAEYFAWHRANTFKE